MNRTPVDFFDVRPGDIVTFRIGARDTQSAPGEAASFRLSPCDFIEAWRETRDLPTEPGSVIHVYQAHGVRPESPVVAVLDDLGIWECAAKAGGHYSLLPGRIEDWRPLTLTEATP